MSRENPSESKEPNKKLNKELRDKALEKLGLSFFFSKNKNSGLIEKYWDYFFTDDFHNALDTAKKIKSEARSQEEKDQALNFMAKILLRQGYFNQAKELIAQSKSSSGFKLFLNFLLTANPKDIIKEADDDIDSQIYKAQTIYLSRIYWGEAFLKSIDCTDDPDQIIEQVFDRLLNQGNYDKALLSSVQSIELILEEQLLSHDIHLPILHEHLANLLKLAKKAKYDSTRAKLYLLKAKIFKDREAASDAEILFGKDHNENGLAEVYMLYAKDFGEINYYEKSLQLFEKVGNLTAQGFLYESLASIALVSGEIKQATQLFERAKEKLNTGGIFEYYGLEIQKISLLAIQGKYQRVKELVHGLIKATVPSFFIGQAYQILANTLIQLGEDTEAAKGYIESATGIFRQLKRYNQLLYTQNVYFQILLLENDLQQINKVGQEIIQLATRLGNEEIKATKYLDLAFVTLRISLEEGTLNDEKLSESTEFFKKAIKLYQEQQNVIGEADTYQAMGNMFTGLGKLEDALNAFLSAKKLYQSDKASLQAAITDTLIGILLLNYVILNDQTYPMAVRHLEQALVYFAKENLLDLMWKVLFYLADINHKYYLVMKDSEGSEVYKNKARSYYLEMHTTIQDYEEEAPHLIPQNTLVGVTIDDAFNKAYQFFLVIDEEDTGRKFRRFGNN